MRQPLAALGKRRKAVPKFETLEEAQKAHDELEAKVAKVSELEKQVAKLNSENAERRKRADELEKETQRLKESAMSDAEKSLSEKLKADLKAEFDKERAEISKENEELKSRNRRLALEGVASKHGFRDAGDAIRLLDPDVDPEKAEEAFKALAEKYPAMLVDTGSGDPGAPPASRGGGSGFKLENGKPVSLEDVDKHFGEIVKGSQNN